MFRRFALAVVLVAITFSFAYSETFFAKVTKVEGNKVTYQKGTFDKDTKKFTYGDATTTEAIKDVPVTKGGGFGGKAGGKKGEALEKGLANEMFTTIDKEKGVTARITIAEEGDNKGKISEVSTFAAFGGKGGAKDKKDKDAAK